MILAAFIVCLKILIKKAKAHLCPPQATDIPPYPTHPPTSIPCVMDGVTLPSYDAATAEDGSTSK